MLEGYIGRVGEGKTYLALRTIVNVLLFQTRLVVTTVDSIQIGLLNEWLQEWCEKHHKPELKPDLRKRLLVIDKNDTGHYYRFRGQGLVLPSIGKEIQRQKGGLGIDEFNVHMRDYFDHVGATGGVVYFLDEAQDHFPARQWDEIGRAVSYHITKHRHLDDQIYMITQAPEKVETDMRRLASRWHVCRNNYTAKVWGVQMPPGFVVKSYYDLPGKHDSPYETTRFKLDLKLAACYKTKGAFKGVAQGPETQHRKGVPFWFVPAGAVLAAVAVFFVLAKVPYLAGAFFRHTIERFGAGVLTKRLPGSPLAMGTKVVRASGVPSKAAVRDQSGSAGSSSPDAVTVDGYAFDRLGPVVWLSDGRTYSGTEVSVVARDGVRLADGREFRFAPRKPRGPALPPAEVPPVSRPGA